MHCRRHMNRGISVQLQAVYRLLVRKIHGIFPSRRKQDSSTCSHEWRYYIPRTAFSERAEQAWSEHIRIMYRTEEPFRVLPLTEQIPSDCIGVLELMDEGKPVCRGYLKLQEECVVKTKILWLLPHETVLLFAQK